ncbi:hypothetical protein BCR34DRAFT_587981 [Clohesyomyces aquaticus]|uniref:Uncharacterized protein n=1 Tax=Clohesyomyces aquaticus TaxID=1231657 RepID=A0A1Y1ZM70_9PLEO|nr:hypothetical protein BCR34DRAFT_587981 [Clohesyomyces aquaticus]
MDWSADRRMETAVEKTTHSNSSIQLASPRLPRFPPEPPSQSMGPNTTSTNLRYLTSSSYRQYSRSLPADLSQFHTLCETYDCLGVDVLGAQSVDDIFAEVKACKNDLKAQKPKLRDAAFKLLCIVLLGEIQDDTRTAAKMFDIVLFIGRFVVTEMPISGLNEWMKKGDANDSDEGFTTDKEESFGYYDSDDF